MIKAKLLMIDDDELFLKNYRSLLSSQFEVITALNIPDGLKKIKQTNPDVLLLDIRLQTEKEGLQALPVIKEQYPDLKIIIVTNWDSHLIFREALQSGADDFFIKSEDLKILEFSIQNLLSQKVINDQIDTAGQNFPIAFDPLSRSLLNEAKKLARANCSVILTGESGVGKEEIARFIHNHSRRKDGPFIAINCAAVPETLIESEFFGHEAGAFTNALKRRIGKFEAANGGTIFLDEIEELSLRAQAKLLRVTQELVVERLGSQERIPIDVRIISATRSNLQTLVLEKRFREDLYYRLAVYSLNIPPLRERRDDIVPLAQYYLKISCQKNGIKLKQLTKEALLVLKNYDWPGNIRELKNALERAVIKSNGKYVNVSDLALNNNNKVYDLPYNLARQKAIDQFTVEYIRRALVEYEGNLSQTAEAIGLSRQMLQKLVKDYQLMP
ncbi:sigma-54-dependent transcriptional regulator [Calditrichota bacterium GD2]